MKSGARLADDTLILNVGQNLLGIYSVRQRKYVAYRGPHISEGILRLVKAREIVSYEGSGRDLPKLAAFIKIPKGRPLHILGTHVDLRRSCFARQRGGASLAATYRKHFKLLPEFPSSPEGRNRCEIYMTFRLWQLCKAGTL